ncbi:MAG: redoxin domain-containing protein [Cocleimonas sp.]|nr:redoxin domain-containing protein [Cocleimonas sp.]
MNPSIMKIVIPLLLIVGALLFAVKSLQDNAVVIPTRTVPEQLTTLDPPLIVPNFELLDLEGKPQTLTAYKGQPLIVNFWATWCPPCRAELPSMNRGWAKIKDEGIAMIAINVGESEDTVFAFTGEYPIDFKVLLDEQGTVSAQWPMRGLPTTFVLNKKGDVVYQAIGGREWDADELLDQVRQLK